MYLIEENSRFKTEKSYLNYRARYCETKLSSIEKKMGCEKNIGNMVKKTPDVSNYS